MGLFDFKFLILLGLAIVIYFIYKELELHRDRLTFCEGKIKEFKQLTFNENNTIPSTPFHPLQQPLEPHPSSQHPLEPHPTSQHPLEPHPSPNSSSSHYNKLTSIQNKTVNDENKNLSILLPIKTLTQSIKNITESSLEELSNSESSKNLETSESINFSLLSKNKNYNLKNESDTKIESESKHLEIYSTIKGVKSDLK